MANHSTTPPSSRPLVCIILGQTASGKSALCQNLATRLDGEILSMDALKVYRGMDIGTAKTPPAERSVPHHLLDLVTPAETFSAGAWLAAMETALPEVLVRNKLPIVDCGTPLYLKVFLSGMLDAPPADERLRSELEQKDSDELHRELSHRDPGSAARLHPNDRKRVIRALEYAYQTGGPISQRQTQFTRERDQYRLLLTGPLWPEALLKQRIHQRVSRMLEQGLLAEVRAIQDGNGFSRTSGEAIGYRQLRDHLEGRLSLADAIEQIERRTWQLARKQLVWFKRHAGVKWLRVESEVELERAAIFLAAEIKAMQGPAHS